jgi:hypothetical protein
MFSRRCGQMQVPGQSPDAEPRPHQPYRFLPWKGRCLTCRSTNRQNRTPVDLTKPVTMPRPRPIHRLARRRPSRTPAAQTHRLLARALQRNPVRRRPRGASVQGGGNFSSSLLTSNQQAFEDHQAQADYRKWAHRPSSLPSAMANPHMRQREGLGSVHGEGS